MASSLFRTETEDVVSSLSAFAPAPAVVAAAGATDTLMVTPGLWLFALEDGDIWDFTTHRGFMCDDNGNCTIPAPPGANHLCTVIYIYRGVGPNGGVLLEKICADVEEGHTGTQKNCGIKEYF